MKKNLYVMSGTPGAGKSTWAKERIENMPGKTALISRDEIRFSLVAEDEPYFSKEEEVFRTFIDKIKEALATCDNVIVDATHLNTRSRAKLFWAINGSYSNDEWEVSLVVVDVCLAECLKQNELRLGTRSYVPPTVIRNMANSFRLPDLEEEIWLDKVIIYNPHYTNMRYRIIEREKK